MSDNIAYQPNGQGDWQFITYVPEPQNLSETQAIYFSNICIMNPLYVEITDKKPYSTRLTVKGVDQHILENGTQIIQFDDLPVEIQQYCYKIIQNKTKDN